MATDVRIIFKASVISGSRLVVYGGFGIPRQQTGRRVDLDGLEVRLTRGGRYDGLLFRRTQGLSRKQSGMGAIPPISLAFHEGLGSLQTTGKERRGPLLAAV